MSYPQTSITIQKEAIKQKNRQSENLRDTTGISLFIYG